MRYRIEQIRYFETDAENEEEASNIFWDAFNNFDEGRLEVGAGERDIQIEKLSD